MKKLVFDGLTLNEFKQFLREIIREEISQQPTQGAELESPIDIEEASVFTRIPKSTLYEYKRKGKIPCHKQGKKLLFYKSELKAWIEAGRIKTEEEIKQEAEEYLSGRSHKK